MYTFVEIEDIRHNLQARGILGEEWTDQTNEKLLSVSVSKPRVNELTELIDDLLEKDWMQGLCEGGVFPLPTTGSMIPILTPDMTTRNFVRVGTLPSNSPPTQST